MQDNAIEPTTTWASTATATTVPGKRKHTFYVTPEGAAPATTPKWAPPVVPPDPRDALKREQNRLARLGALLFFGSIALAIAIAMASGGKFVLIATGPMMAGIALMVRASR